MSEIEPRVFAITFPTRIKVSGKTYKSLNLNIYRNLYHQQLNYQKKALLEIVKPELRKIPRLGVIDLEYTIFTKTKRLIDTMNVGSIADKYFSDALVNCKVLKDDNTTYIRNISFRFGGLSDIAEILVKIIEIKTPEELLSEQKDKTMRLLLDDDDIQQAFVDFASKAIANTEYLEVLTTIENGELVVEIFQNGRPQALASITKPKASRKGVGGRPKGSKNKPTGEPDVEANTDTGTGGDSGGSTSNSETEDEEAPEENPPEETHKTKKPSEGKQSKNLFGGSPEPSSEDSPKEETKEAVQLVKRPVTSIFDEA